MRRKIKEEERKRLLASEDVITDTTSSRRKDSLAILPKEILIIILSFAPDKKNENDILSQRLSFALTSRKHLDCLCSLQMEFLRYALLCKQFNTYPPLPNDRESLEALTVKRNHWQQKNQQRPDEFKELLTTMTDQAVNIRNNAILQMKYLRELHKKRNEVEEMLSEMTMNKIFFRAVKKSLWNACRVGVLAVTGAYVIVPFAAFLCSITDAGHGLCSNEFQDRCNYYGCDCRDLFSFHRPDRVFLRDRNDSGSVEPNDFRGCGCGNDPADTQTSCCYDPDADDSSNSFGCGCQNFNDYPDQFCCCPCNAPNTCTCCSYAPWYDDATCTALIIGKYIIPMAFVVGCLRSVVSDVVRKRYHLPHLLVKAERYTAKEEKYATFFQPTLSKIHPNDSCEDLYQKLLNGDSSINPEIVFADGEPARPAVGAMH